MSAASDAVLEDEQVKKVGVPVEVDKLESHTDRSGSSTATSPPTGPYDGPKINAQRFAEEWSGHKVQHLRCLIKEARARRLRIIWLVGDSSLDNKAWLEAFGHKPAPGLYAELLDPPSCRQDIAFHINTILARQQGSGWICINAAVEASTLRARASDLLPQDKVVRDHMEAGDALICSVGGNDIALGPSEQTQTELRKLLLSPPKSLQDGSAPGFRYFISIFKDDLEAYFKKLCRDTTPANALVCMIYFPCEAVKQESWANGALSAMHYNDKPSMVQGLIQQLFHLATARVCVGTGCTVTHIPLFDVLDATNAKDYVHRVEPSALGGMKMATAFCQALGVLVSEPVRSKKGKKSQVGKKRTPDDDIDGRTPCCVS